jgi:hypothetical protein
MNMEKNQNQEKGEGQENPKSGCRTGNCGPSRIKPRRFPISNRVEEHAKRRAEYLTELEEKKTEILSLTFYVFLLMACCATLLLFLGAVLLFG